MKSLPLALLLLTGCAGLTPGKDPNFWTQCVKADGWGINAISPWGPINVGRITWERNVACHVDQTKPELPISALFGSAPKEQVKPVKPEVK